CQSAPSASKEIHDLSSCRKSNKQRWECLLRAKDRLCFAEGAHAAPLPRPPPARGRGSKYFAMTPSAPNRLCRECLDDPGPAGNRCASCGSPRLLRHAELERLSMAHLD